MRPTLLRFYARATEHTRRLAAIEANAKFGSAGAGPDSGDLNVRGRRELPAEGPWLSQAALLLRHKHARTHCLRNFSTPAHSAGSHIPLSICMCSNLARSPAMRRAWPLQGALAP
jgi:hypothetical protein